MFMGIMELELPNRDAPLNEKQQTGWFDLPYEMRIMIIEMMDIKTKGKLSCCSKLCSEEVRRSKNFIEYILIVWCQTAVDLKVVIQNDNCIDIKFSKVTEDAKERCLMKYEIRNSNPEILISQWERTVDGSVEDIALNYFNRYVNVHLEGILIYSNGLPFDKTSIRHLRKLDSIQVMQRRPTGSQKRLFECGFLSIEQLTSASKRVLIEGIRIEIDQLIHFKASKIIITKITFSPAQLNQYLKAWSENRIDENVKEIRIDFSEEISDDFNVSDVVSGFNVVYHKYKFWKLYMKIENNVGELAKLQFGHDSFFANFDGLEDEEYNSDESEYDYDSDTNSDY